MRHQYCLGEWVKSPWEMKRWNQMRQPQHPNAMCFLIDPKTGPSEKSKHSHENSCWMTLLSNPKEIEQHLDEMNHLF